MTRYRKRPVVIDAVKFTGVDTFGLPCFDEPCPLWLHDALGRVTGEAGAA